ncbi:MAG TPA: hypothetical protein VGO49_07785 [Bradyrhizobium sp.]|nr:hypothetical protein [Bradyrhizobium sp.]
MSFQVTVLKVLAGHPEGRACVADLTRHVSILMSCGPEWTDRTKRLAAGAPELDIFGSGYVLRDDSGWRITDIGRQFLDSLAASSPTPHDQQRPEADAAVIPATPTPIQPMLRLVVDNTRTSPPDRGPGQERRTA